MGQHQIHQHTPIPDYSEKTEKSLYSFSVTFEKQHAVYHHTSHGSSQQVNHAREVI